MYLKIQREKNKISQSDPGKCSKKEVYMEEFENKKKSKLNLYGKSKGKV